MRLPAGRASTRAILTVAVASALALSGWAGAAQAAAAAPAATPGSVAAASPPNADLGRRLDAYLAPLASAGELSGTLLVARGDEVVYERAFGMASYELSVPNTPQTRHGIASITKPLTAIAALRLVDQGRLSVADPLAKWIPDFPRGAEITVEHLVRHRSGLPHRVTTDAEETVPRSAADMARFAARAQLLFPPGSSNAYSSAGYSVLARVLELAAGKPYGELLRDLVLAPAGATHTAHPDGRSVMTGRATSYLRDAAGVAPAPLQDLSFLVGAGSLFSTPRDLHAVVRALLRGVYGESAKASLLRDGALRWNGITAGYRAFADYAPDRDLSVIFAGNLFTGAADLLRRDVPRLVAGEELSPARPPAFTAAAMPLDVRAQVEGIYRLRPGSEEPLRFVDATGLEATLGYWILIPTGRDSFFSPQDYGSVAVARAADGSVAALAWRPLGAGEPIRFERLTGPPAPP